MTRVLATECVVEWHKENPASLFQAFSKGLTNTRLPCGGPGQGATHLKGLKSTVPIIQVRPVTVSLSIAPLYNLMIHRPLAPELSLITSAMGNN